MIKHVNKSNKLLTGKIMTIHLAVQLQSIIPVKSFPVNTLASYALSGKFMSRKLFTDKVLNFSKSIPLGGAELFPSINEQTMSMSRNVPIIWSNT